MRGRVSAVNSLFITMSNQIGDFRAEAKYANGATLLLSNKNPVGVRFEGEDGWIWVTRKSGASVTASDPSVTTKSVKHLDASDPRLLETKLKDSDVHLHVSPQGDHHLDWLEAIRISRAPVPTSSVRHSSCARSRNPIA